MVIAANLGFPSIGSNRELEKAVEGYLQGSVAEDVLLQLGKNLRREHWTLQHRQKINHVPSNDFSFGNNMLDMICALGIVPERYNFNGGEVDLNTYFAMDRGAADIAPMKKCKWFSTSHYYTVPELYEDTKFNASSHKIVSEFKEAKDQGVQTRPVIIGPISFLLLSKIQEKSKLFSLLPQLLSAYEEILEDLAEAGAGWVQIDEPMLATELPMDLNQVYIDSFDRLSNVSAKLHLMVATYFGNLGDNLQTALNISCAGLHIDLISAGDEQLDDILSSWNGKKALSLGMVDGSNLWRSDLVYIVKMLEKAVEVIGTEWLQVAPSCSLANVPFDSIIDNNLDDELRVWLSFAQHKLAEVAIATTGVSRGRGAIRSEMEVSRALFAQRSIHQIINDDGMKRKLEQAMPEIVLAS